MSRQPVALLGQSHLPTNSAPHTAFRAILSAEAVLAGVVTTNYDTLAERVLRHRPMVRDPEPGFYYRGLPRPRTRTVTFPGLARTRT
jgi:hypothetical protein